MIDAIKANMQKMNLQTQMNQGQLSSKSENSELNGKDVGLGVGAQMAGDEDDLKSSEEEKKRKKKTLKVNAKQQNNPSHKKKQNRKQKENDESSKVYTTKDVERLLNIVY